MILTCTRGRSSRRGGGGARGGAPCVCKFAQAGNCVRTCVYVRKREERRKLRRQWKPSAYV